MGLKDCLATAVEGEEISKADADRLSREFDRARARASLDGSVDADAEAKRALQELLKAETAHEKRKAQASLRTAREILIDLDAHRNAGGRKDVAEAALFKLSNNGEAKFQSVEIRHSVIVGLAHARMEKLLDKFRRGRLAGEKARMNRAQLPNVVREAFGVDTGDASAKELAAAWTETAEWLRQRYNAAGGAIGKLENWGLPQWHDKRALLQRGMPQWKQDIQPLLDVSKMKHPLTGKPIHPREIDEILDGIWEGVVTDGGVTMKPSRQMHGKGALANQRQEHRFLVFRDPDAWMKYQADYGGGSDPFATMMGHVDQTSRDIAAMEILGPNPGTTIEWLKQIIRKEASLKVAGKENRFAGGGKDPHDRANRYDERLDAVWGSLRGSLNTPVSGRVAGLLAGVRNLITASVLGSASLSAVSDIGTQQITRAFNGLPPLGVLKGTLAALAPQQLIPIPGMDKAAGVTRREAVAMGLILDQAQHAHSQQARYIGTFTGPAWTAYLADRVLALSMLTPWTQGGKHAFGLAFGHEAAKMVGKAYDELHPAFRAAFARYGIDAAGWDRIRKAPVHKAENGLELLRPNEIATLDRGLAERYLGMILSETEYAIPSGTHRSRTVLSNQTRPGTAMGELSRSFAQFKSFGAVYAMSHGGRVARMVMGKNYRSIPTYAGTLLIAGAFYGAISIQLKQLAAGRDPRPVNSLAFWGAAVLQGGGLGIFGDFLFSDLNRYGGGLAQNIAGPTASLGGDLANLTVGNLIQLATGNETDFAKELAQFARGNVPGGNIWYTRLAWERIVLDSLQYLADPDANKAFKRQQQRWKKDFGQGFWWAPGTTSPQRAPDMGNLLPAEGAGP